MTPWKLPPKEKIYEAYSVLADRRCIMISDHKAVICSSDSSKTYTLTWSEDSGGKYFKVSSNDNASRFQGYTGYPIIALLMILDKISFKEDIIPHFKDINWHKLNKQFKNNYAQAVDFVLSQRSTEESVKIREETDRILEQLEKLNLIR
jgi:hypothetical protein